MQCWDGQHFTEWSTQPKDINNTCLSSHLELAWERDNLLSLTIRFHWELCYCQITRTGQTWFLLWASPAHVATSCGRTASGNEVQRSEGWHCQKSKESHILKSQHFCKMWWLNGWLLGLYPWKGSEKIFKIWVNFMMLLHRLVCILKGTTTRTSYLKLFCCWGSGA